VGVKPCPSNWHFMTATPDTMNWLRFLKVFVDIVQFYKKCTYKTSSPSYLIKKKFQMGIKAGTKVPYPLNISFKIKVYCSDPV
jgi:hypothetical protein